MKKILMLINLIVFTLFIGASKLEASSSGSINGPILIQKEQYSVLTLSDILNLYTSDLGGVSIENDGYTGNGAILGIYEIDLFASDGSNTASKTIEVEVLKSIGYSVRAVTNRKNIHISKAIKLLPQEIVNIHAKTGVFSINQTSQMSIITDNYSSVYNVPGSYLYEYRIMDASGLDMTVSAFINVYESDRIDTPIIIIPARPSFWNSISGTLGKILSGVIFVGIIFGGFLIFRKGKKVI